MFGRPHFGGVAFFCAYAGPKNIGKTKKKKKKLYKSLVRKEKLPHICHMQNETNTHTMNTPYNLQRLDSVMLRSALQSLAPKMDAHSLKMSNAIAAELKRRES